MRLLCVVLCALVTLAVARAEAQHPRFQGAVEYTPSFVGDDLESLENAFGFAGGFLFPVGNRAHVGGVLGWSSVDLKGAVGGGDDTNLLDLSAVVRVRARAGEGPGAYLDLRVGYSRLAFVVSPYDDAVSGLMLGVGLGTLLSMEAFDLDLFARYQHQRFQDDGIEGLLFDSDASGGRVILGAGVSMPLGR